MKVSKEKELYNKYSDRMYRLCFRYLSNHQDAQEIVQNGFLKVFLNLKKVDYRGEKQFENWMKTIFINESINFLKKKKFEFICLEEVENSLVYNTGIQMEEEEYYQLVLDLPTGYRTVFNLYAIEGYSHKDIAEFLNITESISRSQLTKARKLLQQKLNGNHGKEYR